MMLFKCQSCEQVLYFENLVCEKCSHRLGYLPKVFTMSALEPVGNLWRTLANPERTVKFCDNARFGSCNWLIDANETEICCVACRHNRTIPDLTDTVNLTRWRRVEMAKHRLFYTLMRLNLPLRSKVDDPEHGLAFDFLADNTSPTTPRVLTGHDNGLITIALREADDAERERWRVQMGEPYRSLLGHFRHEIGHYFWDVLVRDGGHIEECRAVFGDDSQDYSSALDAYYKGGAPVNWQANFISAYATSHPWEDWAETWAHYMHIVDTVEIAHAFGIRVRPDLAGNDVPATDMNINPYQTSTMKEIIDAWLPLTFAVNSLNRAMGIADLYPFVLSPLVISKLDFIHHLVHAELAPPEN